MIISVSKSRNPAGWAHKYFYRVDVKTLGQLARIITAEHWAGITWKGNQRRADNFEACELCVLDFDDGSVSIEHFADEMRRLGYWYIVGPTKSHRVEKNGKVCDRFRAVLRFSEPITDKEQYYQNMRRIQKCFHSDWQATGPHMKFSPCSSVHSYAVTPDLVRITPRPKKNYPSYKTASDFVTLGDKSIPPWVENMLRSAHKGSRNIAVYKAGRAMKPRAFDQREVYSFVKQCGIDLDDQEIKNTIKSAYRR